MKHQPHFPGTLPPPPQHCDVLILGAGLAGLWVAAELTEKGVSVALIGAAPAASSLEWSGSGFAGLGLAESPHRTVSAVGPELTLELDRWARRSHSLLERCGGLERSGSVTLARDARELRELDESDPALELLERSTLRWTPREAALKLGRVGVIGARWNPDDAQVHGPAIQLSLHRRLRESGCAGIVVGAGLRLDHELCLWDGARRITGAEMVVYTSAPIAQISSTFFAETTALIQAQSIQLGAPLRGTPPPALPPLRTPGDYIWWRDLGAGAIRAGGCRWAAQGMGVRETPESGRDAAGPPCPKVTEQIERVSRELLPIDPRPGHAPATCLMEFTCDGLPLVGPLAGDPARIACLGYADRPWTFAPAAAEIVAKGILGHPVTIPSGLRPSRMAL